MEKKDIASTLEPKKMDLKKSAKVFNTLLKEESKDKEISKIKSLVNAGENIIRQSQRTEVKKFDDSIINELESGLEAIERIIANPRTFIKEQAELVQVGLAKRVSAL